MAARTLRTRLLLAMISLVAALVPGPAVAGVDSFEALTAWAEEKGWLWDDTNRGYRSDEKNSFDIYIKHDRTATLKPFHRSWSNTSQAVTQSGEMTTVAGGIPASLLYTSIVHQDGTRDAEKWEYYCDDYHLLIRAHRDSSIGQTGADPRALLESYIAFADAYRRDGAEPPVAAEPVAVTTKPPTWKLDKKNTHVLLVTVEYMKKRADELAATDKGMADLLRRYADAILTADISYKEKPLLGSGEASCSWFGNITIYKALTDYQAFAQQTGGLDSYAEGDLGVVASLLMHEVAHAKGANEWQAHLLQKLTFDALKVVETTLPDGTKIKPGTRRHNEQYFATYKSPHDPRAQFFYTAWIRQSPQSQKDPPRIYSGTGYGNMPKK